MALLRIRRKTSPFGKGRWDLDTLTIYLASTYGMYITGDMMEYIQRSTEPLEFTITFNTELDRLEIHIKPNHSFPGALPLPVLKRPVRHNTELLIMAINTFFKRKGTRHEGKNTSYP